MSKWLLCAVIALSSLNAVFAAEGIDPGSMMRQYGASDVIWMVVWLTWSEAMGCYSNGIAVLCSLWLHGVCSLFRAIAPFKSFRCVPGYCVFQTLCTNPRFTE